MLKVAGVAEEGGKKLLEEEDCGRAGAELFEEGEQLLVLGEWEERLRGAHGLRGEECTCRQRL